MAGGKLKFRLIDGQDISIRKPTGVYFLPFLFRWRR